MGQVMLVEQKSNKALYAAKKLLKSKKGYVYLKEELKLMQKLKHPNIINLVESYHTPGKDEMIIIMEFCPCKLFLSNNTCDLDGDLE